MEATRLEGFDKSIGALHQLSQEVIKHIEDTKWPLAEGQNLVSEIVAINEALNKLEDEAKRDGLNSTLNALNNPQAPFDQFRVILEILKEKLRPPRTTSASIAEPLIWSFSKDETENLVSAMDHFKSLFNLALQNGNRDLTQSNQNILETIHKQLAWLFRNEETQKIKEWLSPLHFRTMQNDTFARKEPGTGEWFLKDERFKSWVAGAKKYLWCPGESGVGKTILSSIAIDFLMGKSSNDKDPAIAFVYFNHKMTVTPVEIVGSLLKHLLRRKITLSKELQDLYSEHMKKGTSPTFAELADILEAESCTVKQFFVVFDAIDECPDENTLIKILEQLKKLPSVRLMATGRPYITPLISTLGDIIEFEIHATEDDIAKYIEGHMQNLATHSQIDPSLKERIRNTIVENANGMFLMAKLNVDLLAEQDEDGIYSMLEQVEGEEPAVERVEREQPAVEQVEGEQPAMEQDEGEPPVVEQLVGERLAIEQDEGVPPAVEQASGELGHASAIKALKEAGADVSANSDDGLMPLLSAARNGHVDAINALKKVGADASAKRKVRGAREQVIGDHHAGEQLSDIPEGLNRTYERMMDWIHLRKKAEVDVAKTILKWITYAKEQLQAEALQQALAVTRRTTEIKEKDMIDINRMKSFCAGFVSIDRESGIIRLANYSMQKYLENKLPRVDSNIEIAKTCLNYLALGVFSNPRTNLDFLEMLSEEYKLSSYAARNWAKHIPEELDYGLKDIIFETFGSDDKRDLVIQLQTMGQGWRKFKPSYNCSFLHFASSNGLLSICQILLEKYRERNLFSKLVHRKQLYIFEILALTMNRHKLINAKNNDGWTPLSEAAWEGYPKVVELLLDTNAEVDSKDEDGQTPLSRASSKGHTDVAQLLLDAKADKNSRDNWHQTPLSRAASKGHTDVVQLLLDRNADKNTKDNWHQTPLSRAASNGHVDIVKLLLRKNAQMDLKDKWHQTPLSRAASKGHTDVVEVLLKAKADTDSKDKWNHTPLSRAASKGHIMIVQLLLEHEAERDLKDKWHQTPLSRAASKGHTGIVKLLLGAEADKDSKDTWSRTPLSWAASEGHAEVVKSLLDANVTVDSKDKNSRTPLSWAASEGHAGVVKLLLGAKAAVDSKDKSSRTPLSWAASEGHAGVVKLLLDASASVNSIDKEGRTPRSWAESEGHAEVLLLLNSSLIN